MSWLAVKPTMGFEPMTFPLPRGCSTPELCGHLRVSRATPLMSGQRGNRTPERRRRADLQSASFGLLDICPRTINYFQRATTTHVMPECFRLARRKAAEACWAYRASRFTASTLLDSRLKHAGMTTLQRFTHRQSRRRGLNSRPSAYKADALPLSYVGALTRAPNMLRGL